MVESHNIRAGVEEMNGWKRWKSTFWNVPSWLPALLPLSLLCGGDSK
jgi:hypothetical protein